MVKLMGYLQGIAIGAFVMLFMGWVTLVGLERELDRQEAQTEYMCQYYAKAINEHYGHDVCLTRE